MCCTHKGGRRAAAPPLCCMCFHTSYKITHPQPPAQVPKAPFCVKMCAFFHGLRHGRGAHSIHRPFPKRGYLFWGEKAIIAISLYVPGRLRRAARTGCTKTAVSLKRGGAAWADKRACALFCSADVLRVWQASACAAENLQRLCPAARACGAALLAESGADNTAGGFS